MTLARTYQLNVRDNIGFKNMLKRDRLKSKKVSKTQTVTSRQNYLPTTSTSTHQIMFPGWTTANGRSRFWRVATSVMCRCRWSTKLRSGMPWAAKSVDRTYRRRATS